MSKIFSFLIVADSDLAHWILPGAGIGCTGYDAAFGINAISQYAVPHWHTDLFQYWSTLDTEMV
jgi:hypothetical protein